MKNFDGWSNKKKKLHEKERKIYFHEGQIWYCSFGCNIGFEQDGKGESFLRPVLIVKKFNPHVFWGIPLTTTKKTGKYYDSFFYQ